MSVLVDKCHLYIPMTQRSEIALALLNVVPAPCTTYPQPMFSLAEVFCVPRASHCGSPGGCGFLANPGSADARYTAPNCALANKRRPTCWCRAVPLRWISRG